MKRAMRASAAALLAVSLATAACAQNKLTTLSGINLSWNDCGAAGTGNQSFACNANTGSSTLVGSFIAPPGCDSLIAAQVQIDLVEGGVATLDPWWAYEAGGCRETGWAISYNTTALPTCGDYWNGSATVVSAADTPGNPYNPLTNTLRVRAVGAIPYGAQRPLVAGAEYDCFTLTFNHQLTTGAGACSGCATQACVLLQLIELDQIPGTSTGDFRLYGPPAGGRNRATWQGSGALPSCDAVPTQNRTWGQIKSRYH